MEYELMTGGNCISAAVGRGSPVFPAGIVPLARAVLYLSQSRTLKHRHAYLCIATKSTKAENVLRRKGKVIRTSSPGSYQKG